MSRPLLLLLLLSTTPGTAAVFAQFDPSNPQTGPFPTDFLTVADTTQLTARRVNLPLPDCTAQPSLCDAMALVNQLDGFNVQPRLRVTFSGPVDPATLGKGIFLVALDNLTSDEPGLQKPGDTIAVDELVWDPATNSAYAKPDGALDQHRRYALVVTTAVHDPAGNAVAADPAFSACLLASDAYCAGLAKAVSGVSGTVIAASVFTTLSATRWLESARAQIQNMPITVNRPSGQNVFPISKIGTLVANLETAPDQFSTINFPLDQFQALLSGLGSIAFGSYLSPQFLNPQQTIDPAPTAVDVSLPSTSAEIFFHVYLPSAPPPANGYPVVIFGHGFGDNSFGGPTIVSPTLASAGFATIAINVVGHGYGPQSNVVITDKSGNATQLLIGGRGVDLNGDGTIDADEGCVILTPVPIGLRDCFRQTAVDLMQLVRVLQGGLDLDGDGVPDLDGTRIYYVGQSLGAMYGTILDAVEPGVRAAVLNVGGGSAVDIVRWSPAYQSIAADFLSSQVPPLIAPGAAFNDNYPFPEQPVSVNTVSGTVDVQNFMELLEWLHNQGDPITFAPHLARTTLAGVPQKSVLFQMARTDRTMPNPASSDLIRAAGMTQSTLLYRHDEAQAQLGGVLPKDPHPYLALFLSLDSATISVPPPQALFIGLAAQSQVVGFLTSDGTAIPDPSQSLFGNFFEVPAALPNDPGY